LHDNRIAALTFESANPSVVKSIKQRDLLNTWLRLYAGPQRMPRVEDYQPERVADEIPDMVYLTVEAARRPPRVMIESEGSRMAEAYGNNGNGRYLDEYLGTAMASVIMPIYYECIHRALPTYTVAMVHDIYGRAVAYERLLLPFSNGDGDVSHIIASMKTICEDGNFENKNLLRGSKQPPALKLCAIIDRNLFHRAPGRIPAGDVVEFG